MPRTSRAVQEIQGILHKDDLAAFVSDKYVSWRGSQQTWIEEKKELRDYLFATDTRTTTNNKLPWKNSTTLPKLTQLRDNLHANYMAALFPHDNWFKWTADSKKDDDKANALLIEAYIRQKIRESNFKQVISKCLYDYIDFGNAFAEVTYVEKSHVTNDGTRVSPYTGPMCHRISPLDIYVDITADSFYDAGKITRRIVSMGSLMQAHKDDPIGFGWVPDALSEALNTRQALSNYGDSDIDKSSGLQNDGFDAASSYYSSGMVELLEYEGDLFDLETGTVYSNHRVIVMDRRKVVYNEPAKSWFGRSNKEHICWRDRPDNLLGMGPLDNLVGMQYRIDHLENLKADVFDQIAHPVVFTRNITEEWEWGPGERIFGDAESSVEVLRPDATALNADFQIDKYMRDMEELAGAPREAMGIRTPGEKTAFEVQALENAAGRIFQQKIQKFEEQFVEPLLNQMLEAARRNANIVEQVKFVDEDLGTTRFAQITAKTLNSKGKLYPTGARHFAQQAQIVQNLLGLVNSSAYADPAVSAHISGKKIAQIFEEALRLQPYELVADNIRIAEQQQTQSLAAQAQEGVVSEIANRQFADDEEEAPF